MRVFADLHHYELYYSLQLLFEKRLSFELFRPIGLDWYHQRYWSVYPHPATAAQFLSLDQASSEPKDVHGNPLEQVTCVNLHYQIEDGIYYVVDNTKNGVVQKAITLDKFKDTKFDILLCSLPQHIPIFNELITRYQPTAKLIFQVGNAWGYQSGVNNILASTASFSAPSNINTCFYHQEFDLNTFRYTEPTSRTTVNSYIHYMQRVDLIQQYQQLLPQWNFNCFGAGMSHNIAKTCDLATTMRDSAFTWHYKPEGDGFGHVLYDTYACGRPAIIWVPFYQGKSAQALLEDQITCIDISKNSITQNISLLQKYSQPDEHNKICENAYKRFQQVVNFDQEEVVIRQFLSNLR
jgi:hypothetical protein